MKRKVMVIDDDVKLTGLLKHSLEKKGDYEVVVENTSTRAVKRAQETMPDLIILDMSMPGMSGVGFLKEISAPDGKLRYPVLVLTARANMAEFFGNVAVDGFLAKPCDSDNLLVEVDRIINLRYNQKTNAAPVQRDGTTKKKILIGEDDRTVSENLVAVFRKAGYAVDTVFRGPEILERAIAQRPDVIMAKLMLTDMKGDAVAGVLKKMSNTKDIPVVLYDGSQSNMDGSRFASPKSGIREFVQSDNPQLLLRVVAKVLADGD